MNTFHKAVSFFLISLFGFFSPAFAFALGELPVTPPSEPAPSFQQTVTLAVQTVLPPADTTGPVISGVVSAGLLETTAEIAWVTDELATSHLRYGTSANALNMTATLPGTALLVHGAVLTGLSAGTTYYYCIDATDVPGNTSTSCGHSLTTATAETTLGNADTNVPTVSLLTVTPATNSATIIWITDEVANAAVQYGLTSEYDATTTTDEDLELTHTITISNLTPGTEYHYRVLSRDEAGNLATSPDETFTTLSLSGGSSSGGNGSGASGSGSVVSAVVFSGVEASSIGETSATISWTTDLPADSQVEYGTTQSFGHSTTLNATLATSHAVSFSGLAPGTEYSYRVLSKPVGANVATYSTTHTFTTLSVPMYVTEPAVISGVSATPTGTSAAVTWGTDQSATSDVEYGVTTAYGLTGAHTASLLTSHSVSLSDLTPGITYHYRVKSVTVAGDISYSDDHTFTIPAPSGSSPVSSPAGFTTVSISAHDQDSVTLSWQATSPTADEAAFYDIRYSSLSSITNDNFNVAIQAQLTPITYGDVSPDGTTRTYLVAGLSHSTTYYFAVKYRYGTGSWSPVSNALSATTAQALVELTGGSSVAASNEGHFGGSGSSAGGGAGGGVSSADAPTLTNAAGDDGQIVLTWANPDETAYVRTVVVRKEGGYPQSPTDGTVIYEGRSGTYTDTNIQNGTTYYYAIYSYDHAHQYSPAVRVSLAPKVGSDIVKLRKTFALVDEGSGDHFSRDYKRGDIDTEVEHLQRILIKEGIFTFKRATGYFGRYTEESLKKFQAKENLPQTGIADGATRALLKTLTGKEVRLAAPEDLALFSANLKLGDSGSGVEALQEFLFREKLYNGKVTGSYEATTKEAVKAFQTKEHISPVSGYVGPKTRHAIRAATGL